MIPAPTLFPRPVTIMGILNTTPDSFSDGGLYHETSLAVQQAQSLILDGAEIIDIGGESSRPGAQPVALDEELKRVLPVITSLRAESSVTISIDTTKSTVAKEALLAGANIVNDISALLHDPEMIEVLQQQSDAQIVLMHMQGTPAAMQDSPQYDAVTDEVYEFLSRRIEYLTDHHIAEDRIIVDPGIGFGKTFEHNLILLQDLARFRTLGTKVLLGHSRKRFLGEITGKGTEDRDLATAVAAALCAYRGIDIVRVHNVAATHQALQLAEALRID